MMNCLLQEFINKEKKNVSKIFANLIIHYGKYNDISLTINGYQYLAIVDILNKNATQKIGNGI